MYETFLDHIKTFIFNPKRMAKGANSRILKGHYYDLKDRINRQLYRCGDYENTVDKGPYVLPLLGYYRKCGLQVDILGEGDSYIRVHIYTL